MNVFLPYPDLAASARCLDRSRLHKSVVECRQMLKALEQGAYVNYIIIDGKKVNQYGKLDPSKPMRKTPWYGHPATKMFKGHEKAMRHYHDCALKEWLRRGHKSSVPFFGTKHPRKLPPWFGDPAFHESHRSNLKRKLYSYYNILWPDTPTDLEYVWPV